MAIEKRTKLEIKVANKREEILTMCMLRDLDRANAKLSELKVFLRENPPAEEEVKEVNCRILETELDLAELETNPVHSIAGILHSISVSSDFSETRRIEILQRGLSKIEELTR